MIKFSQHLIEMSLKKPHELQVARTLTHVGNMTTFMLDYGWEMIGSGAGGKVFVHDKKDYALKIFSTEDYGYKSWLSFVLKHPNNSFVPKLRGRPIPINSKVAVVRMEKLPGLTRHGYATYVQPLLSAYSEWKRAVKDRRFDYADELAKSDYYQGRQKLSDLIECMLYIERHSWNDVRYDNVLVRADKSTVIIDPLFGDMPANKPDFFIKFTNDEVKQIGDFLASRFS